MPAAVLKPQKRVLGDSTKAYSNPKVTLPSPSAAKRRKIEAGSSPKKKFQGSQNAAKLGSSQPKSQFEEEVLEKLTQDISGLKQQNSEKDQQWDRPSLHGFDEGKDSLCFQQIEAEEGTLHGGRTAIKLFGVTEVKPPYIRFKKFEADSATSERSLRATACHRLPPLPLCRSSCILLET